MLLDVKKHGSTFKSLSMYNFLGTSVLTVIKCGEVEPGGNENHNLENYVY